jgi:hypothetical protein
MRPRARCLLAAAVLTFAGPGIVQATGIGSQPVVIDRAGEDLVALACPSATRCVAIESRPRGSAWEITFNPVTLRASAPRKVIAVQYARFSLACPAADRCVLVTEAGSAVAFDPRSGHSLARGRIAHPYPCREPTCGGALEGDALDSLACPSVHQCTAVAVDGVEVTFDPAVPGGARRHTIIAGGGGVAVACPSRHQCTALGSAAAVTFNPNAPGHVLTVVLEPQRANLFYLACASGRQCTALTDGGDAITLDPRSAGAAEHVTIDGPVQPGTRLLTGIACATPRRCVAVDDVGRALVGDPQSTAAWSVRPVEGRPAFTAVSCTPTALCVAVDDAGRAVAVAR